MCGAKDVWQSTSSDGRRVTIDGRRAMIVEEVNRRSSIQVADICERFGVSEVTARNDLDKLEKGGKLRRTHGGAVSTSRAIAVSYPDQRMNISNSILNRWPSRDERPSSGYASSCGHEYEAAKIGSPTSHGISRRPAKRSKTM